MQTYFKTNLSYFGLLVLSAFALGYALAPSSLLAASSYDASKFREVSLNEIVPAISGAVGDSKVIVPKDLVFTPIGSESASSILGENGVTILQLDVDVQPSDVEWLDAKNRFSKFQYKSSSIGTQKSIITIESEFKKNVPKNSKKIKKGFFQGLKKSPVLVLPYGDIYKDGYSELTEIRIYDPESDAIIKFRFMAYTVKDKKSLTMRDTFIKSLLDTPKQVKVSKGKKVVGSKLYDGELFTMKIPKGWSATGAGEEVRILSESQFAILQINIEEGSVPDYTHAAYSDNVAILKKHYKEKLGDITFIGTKKVTLDDMPAINLEYKMVIDDVSVRGYQVLANKQGITYSLTASIREPLWKKYKSPFMQMIDTFKVKMVTIQGTVSI